MIQRVLEFCRQKELFRKGDRVLVGLSGGADSVCLFLVLLNMQEEWGLKLFPVHINHNLRGGEADEDARFCEELCEKHGFTLITVSVPVGELAREHGWTIEEAGRNARYEAFERLKKEHGCQRIAVAHHKNDQAETVLFQLLRGSRLKGLSGMGAERGDIVRPLLCVTREEIEAYLKSQGQAYCTDRTNLEESYTRNRIRHSVLPAAEKIQPRAAEHIAETAEYLGRVEAYLEKQTKEVYRQAVKEQTPTQIKLLAPVLLAAEPLLAERAVYEALCHVAGKKKDLTAYAVSQCMELTKKQTGKWIQLPQGLKAVREYEVIRIFKEQKESEEFFVPAGDFPWEEKLPDGGTLLLSLWETGGNTAAFIEKMGGIPKSGYTKWYDYDTIDDSIALRTLRSDDEISLYADGRGKKAYDVLAEAKITKEERCRKVVLAAGKRVLWIPGIRGSEDCRVTEKTRRILIAMMNGGKKDGNKH